MKKSIVILMGIMACMANGMEDKKWKLTVRAKRTSSYKKKDTKEVFSVPEKESITKEEKIKKVTCKKVTIPECYKADEETVRFLVLREIERRQMREVLPASNRIKEALPTYIKEELKTRFPHCTQEEKIRHIDTIKHEIVEAQLKRAMLEYVRKNYLGLGGVDDASKFGTLTDLLVNNKLIFGDDGNLIEAGKEGYNAHLL